MVLWFNFELFSRGLGSERTPTLYTYKWQFTFHLNYVTEDTRLFNSKIVCCHDVDLLN